ncbi:NAD(P)H-dependent oxidoreductase [soil metagenome]
MSRHPAPTGKIFVALWTADADTEIDEPPVDSSPARRVGGEAKHGATNDVADPHLSPSSRAMPRLLGITVSTRPERKGPAVAEWFLGIARGHDGFEIDHVDLADLDLPLLDEPKHPRLKQYENEHTRTWSMTVDAADAVVFVAPEYNSGPAPTLVNALNFLYQEWNFKPASFVSYGGISGGTRGVQLTKPILLTLKMEPIVEAVVLPFFAKQIGDDGTFSGTDSNERAARSMLSELARWAEALRAMRE